MSIKIPDAFKKRDTKGIYISLYANFYLDHMKEKTGISIGELVEEMIFNQDNFKEEMSAFFKNAVEE